MIKNNINNLEKMNNRDKLVLSYDQTKILAENNIANITEVDTISIIQLIDILPQFIENNDDTLELKISKYENNFYMVAYENLTMEDNYVQFTNSTLVDALFDAIIWYTYNYTN